MSPPKTLSWTQKPPILPSMDYLPDFLIGASEVTQDLWLVAHQNDSAALARAANALFPAPQFFF